MSDTITAARELHTVPLSSIELANGHNPRGVVEQDASIKTLADNIAERGMLNPLTVSKTDTGYRLIAGERRYWAAVLASLMEVPVAIDHRPVDHPDLEEEHFADAMSENLLQQQMSPLQVARGFNRQKTRGKRTIKEIAAMYGRSQADVKSHLSLLDLSDDLQHKVDAGIVPMTAVAKLGQLARIHSELPDLAASRVLNTEANLTWPDFNRWPITVVSHSYAHLGGKLPSDVYELHGSYPIDRFALDDATTEAFAELLTRISRTAADFPIRFDRAAGEAAQALDALHIDREGRSALIVGQDVANQIASDSITARLTHQRAADHSREQARAAGTTVPTSSEPTGNAESETNEQRAEREREESIRAEIERRAALDARKAAREAACAHNDRLGAMLVRDMSRIKIDDRVIKILTAVPIGARLGDIAMTGARYGFPGWVTLEPGRRGEPKRVYLNSVEAQAKAHEYLGGAKTPGELAGRSLALVVMAMNAQQEAVAHSHRTYFTVYSGGMPWKDEALQLLDDIAAETVGAEILGSLHDERKQQRLSEAAAAKRKEALEKRLTRALKNIKKLSDDELDEIPSLADTVYPRYRHHPDPESRAKAIRTFEQEHERRVAELTAATPEKVKDYKNQSEARRHLHDCVRTVLATTGEALTIDKLSLDELTAFDETAERFSLNKTELAQVKALAEARRRHLAESTALAKHNATAQGAKHDGTALVVDEPEQVSNS